MRPMKLICLPILAAGFLAACAGDNHVTTQSGREPARSVASTSAGAEVNQPRKPDGKYASNRVYLITRLETADLPRGEWRARGDTIREKGSEIEFTELGSGRVVSFTAPHQITPTDSRNGSTVTPMSDTESNRPPTGALYP